MAEGHRAIEIEVAMYIDTIRAEGIVGTLEVAVLEERALTSVQRTGVQTTDKVAVVCLQAVAIGKGQLCLCDGIHTFLAVECRQ